MAKDKKPRFEEVPPDDDQTRIISPNGEDLLSEPVRPIPPVPKMTGAAPEFTEKPSRIPDPAPAPKPAEGKKAAPGSKLRLTKKRTPDRPSPTPQPKPGKAANPVSFELPKEPPISQRQPAYKSSVEDRDDDDGDDSGSLGTALGVGAMILSIAALLIALGVISVGGKEEITSSQIAPGAVGQEQIYDGSVTADKLQPQLISDLKGQVGATGATGPRGPRGKRGAVGAAGITGISTIERSVVGTAASEVSTIANCAAGEIAIGGGGTVSGAAGAVAVTASEPTADFSGWRAAAAQTAETKASWDLTVYAICAVPSRQLRKSIEG